MEFKDYHETMGVALYERMKREMAFDARAELGGMMR